jgi:hypothetical protein
LPQSLINGIIEMGPKPRAVAVIIVFPNDWGIRARAFVDLPPAEFLEIARKIVLFRLSASRKQP